MDKAKIFIPFSKKDSDEQMVYGYATTEAVDSDGEIIDKNAIINALPDYMKFANIREMHQPSAVGKTHQATMDENGLFIKVKVVDTNAWDKVKEGVYNGFSIGGNVVTKVGNRITQLKLSEISLVDRPANPGSLFTVIKMGDMQEIESADEVMGNVFEFLDRQSSVSDVSQIMDLARHLMSMIVDRIYAEKSYDDLEDALNSLKIASRAILGEDSVKKYDEIIDLAKAVGNKEENFAYISQSGSKQLPIASKELVKLSFRKFHTTSFDTRDHKIVAARILKSAAKHFELNIVDRKISDFSDMQPSVVTSKSYNRSANESRYFNNLRSSIG